jgi:hypothetical protein
MAECAKLIEDLEDQISTIIREERLASCRFTVEFCLNYVNIYIPSFLWKKWLFGKLKWKSQRLLFETQFFHHKNNIYIHPFVCRCILESIYTYAFIVKKSIVVHFFTIPYLNLSG